MQQDGAEGAAQNGGSVFVSQGSMAAAAGQGAEPRLLGLCVVFPHG